MTNKTLYLYTPKNIVKMKSLFDDSEFLQSILEEDSASSWIVTATREQRGELERILISNRIYFYYKEQ